MNLTKALSKITKDFPEERERMERLREVAKKQIKCSETLEKTEAYDLDAVASLIDSGKELIRESYLLAKEILSDATRLYEKNRNKSMVEECKKALDENKKLYSKTFLGLGMISKTFGKNETGNA